MSTGKGKGNAIPLLAWADPEGSRRLRLPDFKTIGTWRWYCSYVPVLRTDVLPSSSVWRSKKTGLKILSDVAILREEGRYLGAHRNCKTATKFGAATVVGKSTVFVIDWVSVMSLVLVELFAVLICPHLVPSSVLGPRTWCAAWRLLSFLPQISIYNHKILRDRSSPFTSLVASLKLNTV